MMLWKKALDALREAGLVEWQCHILHHELSENQNTSNFTKGFVRAAVSSRSLWIAQHSLQCLEAPAKKYSQIGTNQPVQLWIALRLAVNVHEPHHTRDFLAQQQGSLRENNQALRTVTSSLEEAYTPVKSEVHSQSHVSSLEALYPTVSIKSSTAMCMAVPKLKIIVGPLV